jgi:hypothetical protein
MILCLALTAVALAATLAPTAAEACSLCDAAFRSRTTFRQEMAEAKLVLYGTISNPQFTKKVGAGSGTTDFTIAKVVKDDPALGNRKMLELNKYLPVLDPKDPPRYLVFCSVIKGDIYAYTGRQVKSDAVLTYLDGLKALEGKDRVAQLQHFFKYLDHPDATISEDAFLEFARCDDKEVANIAPHLPADRLRRLLEDPKTPTERLGMYAFLLGSGGNDKEAAAVLRKMIDQANDRTGPALDGLLCGYIHLEPKAGWDVAVSILADSKKPFSHRFAVTRTLRFYHAWKPAESRKDILRCFAVMLPDGDIADQAIEDLRQWKMWDLTKEVLALYGKDSHDSPLAKRSIVRYALSCPEPAAQKFVAAVRAQDPAMVREQEEVLDLEKGK